MSGPAPVRMVRLPQGGAWSRIRRTAHLRPTACAPGIARAEGLRRAQVRRHLASNRHHGAPSRRRAPGISRLAGALPRPPARRRELGPWTRGGRRWVAWDADVAVIGAGAAGPSLGGSCPVLYRERAAPAVIVVEAPPGPLRSPARTWRFGEAGSGPYDILLSVSWDRLRVYGPDGASLAPSEQPSARLGNPRLLRVRSSCTGCEQAAIGVAPSRSTKWRSSSSATEWRAPDICTTTPTGLNGQFEHFRVEAGCERARAQPRSE